MPLDDWLKSGIVVSHTTSRDEIAGLLGIVERDLRDWRAPGLSPEWQLNIAYNAILQVATAALAAAGHRVRRREGGHYYTLQSLAYTVGVEPNALRMVDALRQKRHLNLPPYLQRVRRPCPRHLQPSRTSLPPQALPHWKKPIPLLE